MHKIHFRLFHNICNAQTLFSMNFLPNSVSNKVRKLETQSVQLSNNTKPILYYLNNFIFKTYFAKTCLAVILKKKKRGGGGLL